MDIDTIMNTDLTWLNVVIWYIVALVAGCVGGAIGGIIVGGKHLGYGLASTLGAFFGPIATTHGVLLALIILNLI